MGEDLKTVVVINDHAFVNGGQAKVAIDSAIGLADAGIEVIFFAASGPVDRRLKEMGVKVICLGQYDILAEPKKSKAMIRGLWNSEAANCLGELLNSLSVEDSVVHCHGFAKALSPSIGPVLMNSAIPYVYTMHEFFLACPNGGFYNYPKNEICTKKALGLSCLTTNCDVRHPAHKLWRVARQFVAKKKALLPTGLSNIIYISELQKRVMFDYLSDDTVLHYVPNPVGTKVSPERVDAKSNSTYVFVGRLNPEKGCVLLAQVAKKLGVSVMFVGEGVERDNILEANSEAIITGWLKPEEVSDCLRKARCLVFPSLWYETFGLVACEALVLGVPVVVGSWNSAAEVVVDGVNGIIVEKPNVHCWENALMKVDSLVEAAGVGQIALNGDYGIDEHVRNLLKVYCQVRNREDRGEFS